MVDLIMSHPASELNNARCRLVLDAVHAAVAALGVRRPDLALESKERGGWVVTVESQGRFVQMAAHRDRYAGDAGNYLILAMSAAPVVPSRSTKTVRQLKVHFAPGEATLADGAEAELTEATAWFVARVDEGLVVRRPRARSTRPVPSVLDRIDRKG